MAFNTERTAATYAKEILKYPKGFEAVRNAVIDGTQVAANGDGRFIVESGQVMIYTNTPEVQHITINATGGTWTVDAGHGASGNIAWNATPAAVQAAIEAVTGARANDVVVSGVAGSYVLTFNARVGNPANVVTDPANLTGGAGTAVVAVTTQGTAPGPGQKVKPAPNDGSIVASQVAGILQHTTEFYNPTELNKTDSPVSLFFDSCIFDTSKLLGYSGNAAVVKAALPTCTFE